MSAVDRYTKRWITLPDGRQVSGRIPGRSAVTLLEHWLRDELAVKIGGATEANLPFGRADVLTDTAVFEVEPFHSWRKGMHQALAYSAQTGLPPALALFGAAREDQVRKIYDTLKWGKPFAHLWWYTGSSWLEIRNTGNVRPMKAPQRRPEPITDDERSLRATAAAHAMHAEHDRRATTAKARSTFMQRFEDQVDPDRTLPEDERLRRAESARKAHFASLAYKRERAKSRKRSA